MKNRRIGVKFVGSNGRSIKVRLEVPYKNTYKSITFKNWDITIPQLITALTQLEESCDESEEYPSPTAGTGEIQLETSAEEETSAKECCQTKDDCCRKST